MRRIRALLVEDIPDNGETIRDSLNLYFRQLGDWQLDWKTYGTAIEARQQIATADPFDFAIVDLDLGEGQPDGVSVADDLRRRDPSTFVLLITARSEKFAPLLASQDPPVIIRRQLNETRGAWSFSAVAKRILLHLRAHAQVPGELLSYDEGDVRVVSLLESLGGTRRDIKRGVTVVSSLALKCLDSVQARNPKLKLHYLSAGRSGAHVCRIDYAEDGQPTQSFVLKLGLDAELLRSELSANREAAKALREQSLVSIASDVHRHGAYSAFIARVADRAPTLRYWLADASSAGHAKDLAAVLFREELVRLSTPELRSTRPIAAWFTTSAAGRLRVRRMLDRTLELVAHPKAGKQPGTAVLREEILGFVDRGELPVRSPGLLAGSVVLVHGFGDLHSANVLVQRGTYPRPVLIDASHYGPKHWGADRARLLVDLTLQVRGDRVAAFLWDDFAESLQRSIDLCPRCGETGRHGSGSVDLFLDQVSDDLPVSTPFDDMGVDECQWHWQWHVCLAKEFLRRGSNPDIETPRSGLAAAAAGHHLRLATELLDGLAS